MNQTEYIIALETFLKTMEQRRDLGVSELQEVLRPLCQLLQIGQISAEHFISEQKEAARIGENFLLYQSKPVAEEICKRFVINDTSIMIYHIHAETGSKWTEEQQEKIDFLIHMLSVFNSRALLIGLTEQLMYYDHALDMPNIRYYERHVAQLMKNGGLVGYVGIFFNLKHFSVINQQIGREKGTLVMKRYAMQIQKMLTQEGEIICRVGGDNFAVLVKEQNMDLVLKILEGIGIFYHDDTKDRVLVTATAGVYIIRHEDDLKVATDLTDKTSLACYNARYQDMQDVVFFDSAMLERKKKNVEIENLFPEAIRNEEFLVFYQPKISLTGYEIAGAEALCRWKHNGKLIPPFQFIPVLEQGMDICTLDFYMLEHVCRDIRRWLDEGRHVVRISVNLSRRHMTDMDLLEHILEIIDRNHVPHEYIEIELTETTTDVEFKDLKRVVYGLQKTGISTSVDDFGIGYSSLNLIKEIPWNVLKVDKSFLPTEQDDDKSLKAIMFRHVIAMAQELGLECIAEGVETKEQVELLRENCCNLAQGFFFDKPLPVTEFESRLDTYIYHE